MRRTVLRAFAVLTALALPPITLAQTTDTIRVRVHNHEIVLYRTGARSPTIILEAGGGSSHRVWNALVPHLAAHARVLSYDRPGYGLSTPCDSPRTALRIARELRDALTSAGVLGPYYLAGWSFGGAIVRTFAGEYPHLASGLLLVDPAPEEFYVRAPREQPDLWSLEEESYFPSLFTDSSRRAEQRELAAYSPSMEQARASDVRHTTPTSVLIAGRNAKGEPDPISLIWIQELERWAAMRPRTTAVVVWGVGHHIARERPAAVVDAFLALTKLNVPQ